MHDQNEPCSLLRPRGRKKRDRGARGRQGRLSQGGALWRRLAACVATGLLAATAAFGMEFDSELFIDVSELRPGMKGIGKTVFQGAEMEEFEVEVLGVLYNATPGGDKVLVRLLSERLAHTGIVAGMSGSPVYIDHRLLGAVAYNYPFSKEAIGLVTPIRSMLELTDRDARNQLSSLPSPLRSPKEVLELVRSAGSARGLPVEAAIAPVTTPLFISGGSPEFFRHTAPLLSRFGWMPVQAGGGGGGVTKPLEPGSAVAIALVSGDFSYSAIGTVTYRDGPEVLAFGHPLLLSGASELPVASATIHVTLPSLMSSFKIGSAGTVIGSLVQDRQAGCLIRLDRSAPLLPVTIVIRGLNSPERRYNVQLAQNEIYTPLLLYMVVSQVLIAESRSLGSLSLVSSVEAELEGHGILRASDTVVLVSDPVTAAYRSIAPVLEISSQVYEPVRFRRIHLELKAVEDRHEAIINRLRLPSAEVRRGEEFEIDVELEVFGKPSITLHVPIRIPFDTTPGEISLHVLDRGTYEKSEAERRPGLRPRSVADALRLAEQRPGQNEFQVVLYDPRPGVTVGAKELERLPPTALSLLSHDLSPGEHHATAYSILYQTSVKTDFAVYGSLVGTLMVQP